MSDIVTTRIFTDGEKGITAAKLNDIVAGSSIQTDFVATKPVASTMDPADNLLVLKSSGQYAKAPFQTIVDSVNTQLPSNDAEIWLVRLKSLNSVGNCNFEVTQRNTGGLLTNPVTGTLIEDRWIINRVGATVGCSTQAASATGLGGIAIPGTNFLISRRFLRVTLTTQQASLGTTDQLSIFQNVEGSMMRELSGDVHSLSLLVRSSVAGLKFAVNFRDSPATQSLVKLCTIPTANVWTLIPMPNLPVWPGAGNFSTVPGVVGYLLGFCLAAGANIIAPTADTWQSGSYLGAPGMSNFAAQAVNSTFDVAMVQHEPGAVCSTLMDKPFAQNYDECLRYFQKTYDYDVVVGTAAAVGSIALPQANTTLVIGPTRFHKPMAKIPTVISYVPSTGAANSLFLGGTAYAVTGFNTLGKAGFLGITTTTMPAVVAGAFAQLHYTADTGW